MALIELECQQKVDSMKKECDDRIAAGEADYESKVKQVLREVNTKIVTQEQESHKAIDDAIRKGHSVESRIEKEHREVTHELQKQIDEHAQEVDSICERYEEQLNEKKAELKTVTKDFEDKIGKLVVDHQSQVNELEFRLEHQESQHMNEMSDMEARLQEQLNELQKKQKDTEDLAAMNSLDPISISSPVNSRNGTSGPDMQILALQAELQQQRGLMAEMKLKEKRLEEEITGYRQGASLGADGDSIALSDGQILTKTTEIQYLKHVLYQYMMGKEPK
ncbi:putative golgin subfamily A member 4, partial [Apostichopus japonicus]